MILNHFNRLKKNKGAIFGLATILLLTFLAVFAYLFIGDKTPDANSQISEIALARPFTKTNTRVARHDWTSPLLR